MSSLLIALFLVSSVVIYFIQDMIFNHTADTLFYLLQDLAFLPVQVAIVTFVINRLLNAAEQRKKIKKTSVIISVFFTEAGITIMRAMAEFNRSNAEISSIIDVNKLNQKNRMKKKKMIQALTYDIYADGDNLERLAEVMKDRKSFLISLLENSSLLEHDSFTDMLWAVFHVADELQYRGDLRSLSPDEISHLSNDILRAYSSIVEEWIGYMIYLRDEYPFLYELAKKKN